LALTLTRQNYASVMLIGVLLLSTMWYFAGGRKQYRGPRNFTGGSAHAVLTSAGERKLSDLPTVASHSSENDYLADKADRDSM